MGLPDEPAGRVLVGDLAGRRGLQPHLVLERRADDAVAPPRASVLAGNELRHEEHRDAFDAGRRVGQPRQHQVDDVVGQVVLAGRDEDLAARDQVAAVCRRGRPGADQGEVGAALRFGQAHGAGPLARHHLRQVAPLQLLGAVPEDGLDGPVRQARIEAERQVRRAHHLLDELVDAFRQALAAVLRLGREARPAGPAVEVIGLAEALGGAHDAVLEAAALQISARVDRQDHLGRDLGGLLQHAVDDVGRERVGEGRELSKPVEPVQLVQHEAHVAEGSVVELHVDLGTTLLPFGREKTAR